MHVRSVLFTCNHPHAVKVIDLCVVPSMEAPGMRHHNVSHRFGEILPDTSRKPIALAEERPWFDQSIETTDRVARIAAGPVAEARGLPSGVTLWKRTKSQPSNHGTLKDFHGFQDSPRKLFNDRGLSMSNVVYACIHPLDPSVFGRFRGNVMRSRVSSGSATFIQGRN